MFSADGKTLAAIRGDQIFIWNLGTGREISRFSISMPEFHSCALSPNGAVLATGHNEELIRLWDVATGKLTREFSVRGFTHFLAFEPDGRTITSVNRDGILGAWDTAAGKESCAGGFTLGGRAGPCLLFVRPTAGWSPALDTGGRSMSSDTLRIWDAATGEHVQTIRFESRKLSDFIAFSPDGKTVASSSGDGKTVRLWDVETGKEKLRRASHQGPVLSVAFGPDDKRIASTAIDGTLMLWDVGSGRQLRVVPDAYPSQWDQTTDAAKIRRINLARIRSVSFTPGGESMISISNGGELRLWDVANGKEVRRMQLERIAPISAVAFGRGGKSVAAASEKDGSLACWDVLTGMEIRRIPNGHVKTVRGLAFAPDGNTIASACDDGAVRLWATATMRVRRINESPESVQCVAFSPDGKTVCMGGVDPVLRFWKPDTKEVQRSPEPDFPDLQVIRTVAFSPDGKWVAWGGDDHIVRTWDVERAREGRRLEGHRDGIYDLEFSNNSRFVASSSGDGMILIWDAHHLAQ